ncbi:MAG: DUF2961 domain-containing protein [Planctomycetota bacterium]
MTATFALLFALALPAEPQNASEITTGSLVREMIDMARLADLPDPFFHTVQFSSYDRRSSLPGGPNWFGNSDGFGGEEIPNFEAVLKEPDAEGIGKYLICDVEGPGAVVRVWTAAIEGTMKMILDGASEPVFDGSADDFLRRPYNVYARELGIDEALFDGAFNQQNAAYCPIPFAKRCRIEWTGPLDRIHFYEVQVRLYEKGARVKTFAPGDLKTYAADVEAVSKVLREPSKNWRYQTAASKTHELLATLPPGERRDLLKLEGGPGALEMLRLRVRASDIDRALRQTVLSIHCDGQYWGQVESPLGDFFGAAPGINPFDSVPFTVELDGSMTCRFCMPYRDSLVIAVENRGAQQVTVSGAALPMAWDWDAERSMHLRARWRVDHDITGDPAHVQDLPFLVAQGKGRYVGTASFILNPNNVPTPYGSWWGEGDEKVFVDDETRPGIFGTGSEDYYNYAWSIPDIFLWAYCGQPRNDGPGNRGFVTNFRWHVLDSLPFAERIAFYMELYTHMRTPGMSYARMAWHYARPMTIDDHLPISDADLRPLALKTGWIPESGWGARNSVFHEPETVLLTEGATLERDEGALYSAGRLCVWRPGSKGESLSFVVPIEEAGKYSVDLCVEKTGGGGSFELLLRVPGEDGQPKEVSLAEVDLREPGRTNLRRVSTPAQELPAGQHELILVNRGNPNSRIGIDFIWIQKR